MNPLLRLLAWFFGLMTEDVPSGKTKPAGGAVDPDDVIDPPNPDPHPPIPPREPEGAGEPAPSSPTYRIGRAIVDVEARRDSNGHLRIYDLPANDGGGSKEIAGINSKYHPEALERLIALPPSLREEEAARYIEDYTRRMTGLSESSALRAGTELFVLDSTFNRGGGVSAWIVQTAVQKLGFDLAKDRLWGPKTRAALEDADAHYPDEIVGALRRAREEYERDVVGVRSNFWQGLVNRWDKMADFADEWNEAEEPARVETPPPGPDPGVPIITLPREGTASLNAFYGTASPSGGFLDWFSFPVGDVRLYSRSGEGLSDRNGDGLDDHRCHRAIKTRLESALAAVYRALGEAEFYRQGWHVYGGCFNYRVKRGGHSLSTHSWGIAIDVNPGENSFHATKTTFSELALNVMERHGFLSGGRAWGKDWMHFQAAIPHISAGSYYAKNGLPKHIKSA